MGNQHEIIQTAPGREGHGVILKVRDGHMDTLLKMKPILQRHYMCPLESTGNETVPNLDAADIRITEKGAFLCIQSGGKMWCGYDNFQQLLGEISVHAANATFYIGDEIDFIDKYEITDGKLSITRCHSGYWRDLKLYLQEQGIL